jgi:glutaredoxin
VHVNAQHTIEQSEKNNIIVYGSDSCHSCLDTKVFLKEREIKFIFYNIDLYKEKEQEMLVKLQKANISIRTLNLPVIDLKGQILLNKGNLDDFLKALDKKIKRNEN